MVLDGGSKLGVKAAQDSPNHGGSRRPVGWLWSIGTKPREDRYQGQASVPDHGSTGRSVGQGTARWLVSVDATMSCTQLHYKLRG